MCGPCDPMAGKAATGIGALCLVLAAVSKLAHWSLMGLGPRSFAVGAALLFLFAIALNTKHHDKPGGA